MKSYVAVPINIGFRRELTNSEQANHFERFYEFLTSLIGSNHSGGRGTVLHPILVSKSHINFSDSINTLIREEVTQTNLVFLDFLSYNNNIYPSYAIISGCGKWLTTASKETMLVILLETYISDDIILDAMDEWIDSSRIVIVDANGQVYGNHNNKINIDKNSFNTLVRKLKPSTVETLKRRIVRRIGHHVQRRNGGVIQCNDFYFDGRYASELLVDAIVEQHAGAWVAGSYSAVVSVAPEGHWIHNIGAIVSEEFGLAHLTFNKPENSINSSAEMFKSPLFLFPMCDSGETIAEVVTKIQQDGHLVVSNILAIFSVGGASEFLGQRSIVLPSKIEINVDYIVRVEQKRRVPGQCRYCRANVPNYYETHPNSAGRIDPVSFWSMVMNAGVKLEKDVPSYRRPSLGYIPDFSNIASENSSFIGSNIIALLESSPGKLPAEPVVVCPDEEGAKALARTVSAIARYSMICIPREIIRKAEDEKLDRQQIIEIRESGDNWCRQLVELSQRRIKAQPIILDEFNVSGNTITGLRNVLANFDLDAWCAVTFVSFQNSSEHLAGIRFHSCYDLEVD